jgi:hypothetical protein
VSLAEGLDVEFFKVVKVEIKENSTVDVVDLEAVDDCSVHAGLAHPIDHLIGRPRANVGVRICLRMTHGGVEGKAWALLTAW